MQDYCNAILLSNFKTKGVVNVVADCSMGIIHGNKLARSWKIKIGNKGERIACFLKGILQGLHPWRIINA